MSVCKTVSNKYFSFTMATECNQEAVLDFLKEKGGKVKNTDLIEHFKAVFPEEPEKKAAVRQTFKNYVDNVAFVKTESGIKYVCLKKKFRSEEMELRSVSKGTESDQVLNQEKIPHRYPTNGPEAARASDAEGELQQQTLPGSGYGNDSQVRVPHAISPATILQHSTDKSKCHEFVCIVEDGGSDEMGNRQSFRKESKRGSRRDSKRESVAKEPDIPEIAVIEASPLPAEETMFTLPGPVQTRKTTQVDAHVESLSLEGLREAEEMTRRRNSLGSLPRFVVDDGDDDQLDTHSLSGSEGNGSPRGSRKHFIEAMMNSSPQVRRSMVLRNSVHLPSRSNSDSVSLVSSNLDEDRTSVTLDPLEHEWMMCSSDGEWGSLHCLLATEPSLILRKDFVTGFTCLHWAAKHGKPELIALIINFAKQHHVPISIDVRSNSGYTPLHVAAMHNHMEVVKLLVGAYNTDVEIRDYSGRKACQYLTDNVSVDIQDIIGAYERSESKSADCSNGARWRFSKVLQSNLKPLKLLNPNDCDSVDGEGRSRLKPVRRTSTFSRMKPKLQRLRWRTSQIVHSTTFHSPEELERSERGSFKSRPKTHFFG